MKTWLMLIGVFGASMFLMLGLQGRLALRKMTTLQIRRAEREEAAAREARLPFRRRLVAAVRRSGYDGNLFPAFAAFAFLYLFLVVGITITGISYVASAIVALPVAVCVVAIGFAVAASRRRRRFNAQLIELLDLVGSQVQAGHGVFKALTIVTPTMQEPMRREMSGVIGDFRATKDLVAAMRVLEERYPSRAMAMFVAALEIDQAEGQAIGPSLAQASNLLKKQFALAAEATAEISQTRGEFFGVIGILCLIAGKMIFGSGPETMATYTSSVGLIVIIAGFGNMAFGVWRFLRLLSAARGGE